MTNGRVGLDLQRIVDHCDDSDLACLYEEFAPVVFRLAYRITESAADAADVAQDVFIGLPEALPSLRADTWSGFASWLRTITVRSALQSIRKRKRLREVAFNPVVYGSAQSGSAEDRIALDQALTKLSDVQRAVFTLKEIEGFSHQEISETLGITIGASEARLHRARKRLFGLLGSER